MGCSNDFNIYGFTSTILNLIMDLKNNQTLIVRGSGKPEDILPRLESTILDRKKQYVDKINVLLASWEHVSTYLTCASSEVIDNLISFIYRHTLYMILKADWRHVNKAIKTHLKVTVTKCHRELDLRRSNHSCTLLCCNLMQIMNDPWDVETFANIINGNQTTEEEVQKYFLSENGVLVVMRIEALVDSKCEDFALRLADTCQQFLKRQKARESNNNPLVEDSKESNFSSYQLDLITDIYLTLLYRCGKNSDLISVLQEYDLKEGVDLLQRFHGRKCGMGFTSKLWKNYVKIAEFGSIAFLSAAFFKPIDDIESCNLLEALITEWLSFQKGDQSPVHDKSSMENVIKKLVYTAVSSQHIYTVCQVLRKHFGLKLKSFCIELFIIALTVNMNEIETQKNNNDKDKVREAEIKLANGFLLLADLLEDDLGVCRECVLTAFSLNPTEKNLERLKALAVACGKCAPDGDRSCLSSFDDSLEGNSNCTKGTLDIGLDTGQKSESLKESNEELQTSHFLVCSLHGNLKETNCAICNSESSHESLPDQSSKKERTLDALIRIKGKAVTESLNYDVLSAPSQVLDAESLGLSSILCNDLATVISSPRYQMLSWVQDWPEMLSICESYLASGGEMKNQTKELKFLNIDYNIFKDWPEDVESEMYGGIEKGYEQCIDPNDDYYIPTEIVQKKFDSDSSESILLSNKTKKRGRPRKNLTDLRNAFKKRGKPKSSMYKDIYSLVSDTDSGTQDSILNTDSLGSDSFQVQPTKKRKRVEAVTRKLQIRTIEPDNCTNKIDNDSNRGGIRIIQKKTSSDTSDSILALSKIKNLGRPRKNSTDLGNALKKRRKTKSSIYKGIYPLVSDTDSGTQDSILSTDSSGSDGFQVQPTKGTQSVEAGTRKLRRRTIEPNNCQNQIVKDSNREGIASDMSKILNEFSSNLSPMNQQSNLSFIRKESDPFVVKTLRMFRRKPNHFISSPLEKATQSFININNNVKSCDDLSHKLETKSMLENSQNNPKTRIESSKNDLMARLSSTIRLNSKFSDHFMNNNDENCVNGKNISSERLTRDNLCKTVPGLNSLDMIIPALIQPTVQIVQLPDNWNQVNNSAPSTEIISSLHSQPSSTVQTTRTTSSEQNKSSTSSSTVDLSSSASTSHTQTSLSCSSTQVQSSTSVGTSISRNAFPEQSNSSMPSVFSQLVSTAKASQTSSRSKPANTSSMSTSSTSHIVSHAVSRASTGTTPMTSTSVSTSTQVIRPLNAGQCEMVSTTASQSNNVSHIQGIVQSIITISSRNSTTSVQAQPVSIVDSTKVQSSAIIKGENLSKKSQSENSVKFIYKDGNLIQSPDKKANSQEDYQNVGLENEVRSLLQTSLTSETEFSKGKVLGNTKELAPSFSEDNQNVGSANKQLSRIQVPRSDRCVGSKIIGLGDSTKERKTNLTEGKASSANESNPQSRTFPSDIEYKLTKAKFVTYAKDMPNNTVDSRNASSSNEMSLHLQSSITPVADIDLAKAKILPIAFDERLQSLVTPVADIDLAKAKILAITKDPLPINLEESRNPSSSNELCVQLLSSVDSDNELSRAKFHTTSKSTMSNFSEDNRNASSTNRQLSRIQSPRLDRCVGESKVIGLGDTKKDRKQNSSEDSQTNNSANETNPSSHTFSSDLEYHLAPKSRLIAYAKDVTPKNAEDRQNICSATKHLQVQLTRLDSSVGGKIIGRDDIGKDRKSNLLDENCASSENETKITGLGETSKEKSDSLELLGFSQIASLPKFQQAFGKTMYQTSSSSIATQSNPEGVTEYTVAVHTPETSSSTSNLCSVLSKAVQTSNKETDNTKTIKPNQKNVIDQNLKADNSNLKLAHNLRTVQTVVASNVQPAKIAACYSTSSSCIIQRKPVGILKTIPTEKGSQTKMDSESGTKESVIHSNMNALLTAALQTTSSYHNSTAITSGTSTITTVAPGCISKTIIEIDKKKPEMSVQTILPVANVHRVALPTNLHKNVRRQPVLSPTKFSRPVVQLTGQSQTPSAAAPSSPLNRSVQSVLTPTTRNESLISHNTISETSVSSKTLEQLREFESVLEQVTNTSQMKERSTVQPLSANLEPLAQPLLQISSQTSTSNTTNFTNTTSSQSPSTYQSQPKSNNVGDLHGERVSLTFIGQTPSISSISDEKISTRTPIVLVQNCSRLLTSPASSSSSPSSASSSVNSSSTKLSIKSSKTAKSKSTSKSNPTTTTLKVSTIQKPQQKPQEDEQTTQRIYAILDKYAEQLRNSPELKNKPAPRRRSNPPTNPSPTSKRKKSTQTKSKLPSQQASCSSSGMEMSPGSEDLRTMGSEDSSNGVSQISQVLNSPQSRLDEPSTPTGDISSETSESLDSKEPRVQHRVVLTDSPVQNRAVIVQDNIQPTVINVEGTKVLTRKQVVVGGTTAMPLFSLSNVPGSTVRLFPEGRLAVVTSTKVPKMYRLVPGSPLLAFQPMCVNKQTSNVKQVKNAIVSGISSQSLTGVSAQPAVVLPPDGQFTLSSDAGLEGNISLDNTILINTTTPSSISFLHRSVQSNFSGQDTSVPRLVTTSASIATSTVSTNSVQESSSGSFQSTSVLPVSCLKPDSLLSICTSNVNIVRQDIKEEQTEDKILETDFRSDPGTDVDAAQSSDDKRWALLSVEKSLQSSQSINSDKVLEFKVMRESPVETFGFQSPTNLQNNQGKTLTVKTDSKEQESSNKALEEPKCLILKKESPKNETDDENVSSDSTSSGRAKQEKPATGKRNAFTIGPLKISDSSWRYSVLGKPGSPKESVNDDTQRVLIPLTEGEREQADTEIDIGADNTDSHRRNNHASISRSRRYQRTASDVQNTIYQMAFRRSDRLRASRKPREQIDSRKSLEGELRLQKSLSEECEDLGVDEPSTSDLFPEAELLLDPDPSSRDSSAQRPTVFTRSFDSASLSSSPPSSRSTSPKRRRLSSADGGSLASTGFTSDESKGAANDDNDGAHKLVELSSAWDDESVSLHLVDNMSAAAEEPGSPTFIGVTNPAASAPFTYSNSRSRFKSKMEKDEGDSDDASEAEDKCATSTTDEEMLSESDYRHVVTANGLALGLVTQKSEDKVRLRSSSSLSVGVGGNTTTCAGDSLSLSRRSSLRGHVKKGCMCCNGSPDRSERPDKLERPERLDRPTARRRKDQPPIPSMSLSFKRAPADKNSSKTFIKKR